MKAQEKKAFWQSIKSGEFESMVRDTAKGQLLTNSTEVYNLMKPIMAGYEGVETCWFIFMDAKNRVIAIDKLASGSINSASVYPREVVKAAISRNAACAIMIHNHPSGDPTPSPEDHKLTKYVELILGVIGCTLHEHMIVGDGYYSFTDEGVMKMIKRQNADF